MSKLGRQIRVEHPGIVRVDAERVPAVGGSCGRVREGQEDDKRQTEKRNEKPGQSYELSRCDDEHLEPVLQYAASFLSAANVNTECAQSRQHATVSP